MTGYSFYTKQSTERGAVVPGTLLKICAPYFMFGPPVAAYIQLSIFKMCLVVFVPLAAKSWRRARFYKCIRCRKAKTRQSISSNLSVRMPIVLPVQRYNIAIWQRWNLETWSRSQESSRGPILRVSVSKATGLGHKPIVLRL